MSHQTGYLAQTIGFSLPLRVLRSGAGHYIGTADHEGPVSRESVEYFNTPERAQEALDTGRWTQKQSL